MTCRICGYELRPQTQKLHCKEHSHYGDLCMGCFEAEHALEMFVIRGTMVGDELGHAPMGPWACGWLREILKEPGRYL